MQAQCYSHEWTLSSAKYEGGPCRRSICPTLRAPCTAAALTVIIVRAVAMTAPSWKSDLRGHVQQTSASGMDFF